MTQQVALRRDEEPIAALATAVGSAALGVIRVSGVGCIELVAPFIAHRKSLKTWVPRNLTRCDFVVDGVVIDDLTAVIFRAPHSFTGQDSLELICHGGPFIIKSILGALYRSGIREADPGEFTRRACLNGKMDLIAAEGIKDLVGADTEQQWLAGRHLLTGRLRQEVAELRDKLIAAMAWLEAQIDFPDEGDTAGVNLAQVDHRVDQVEHAIDRLSATWQSGKVASQGLTVALYGQPNAGKSTLLNALLGQERALVSDTPGTTRDYIEARCLIGGRLFNLIDMAGIREEAGAIEAAGIKKARELAIDADVVVHLIAPDTTHGDFLAHSSWLAKNTAATIVTVLTKADIGTPSWWDLSDAPERWVQISCNSKSAVQTKPLTDLLLRIVEERLVPITKDQTVLTTPRQVDAILRARRCLQNYHDARQKGQFEECLAFELQQAARALASIAGDVSNEDILDKVFSDFCIGK